MYLSFFGLDGKEYRQAFDTVAWRQNAHYAMAPVIYRGESVINAPIQDEEIERFFNTLGYKVERIDDGRKWRVTPKAKKLEMALVNRTPQHLEFYRKLADGTHDMVGCIRRTDKVIVASHLKLRSQNEGTTVVNEYISVPCTAPPKYVNPCYKDSGEPAMENNVIVTQSAADALVKAGCTGIWTPNYDDNSVVYDEKGRIIGLCSLIRCDV